MQIFRNILMADVVGSGTHPSTDVQKALANLVTHLNQHQAGLILSPLTVTLGDEFQGVTHRLSHSLSLILSAEEFLRRHSPEIVLRYVLYEGVIETSINRRTSYGMLGPGLTAARDMLTSGGSRRPKFQLHLQEANVFLPDLLTLLATLLDGWSAKDASIIQTLLDEPDDSLAAEKLHRDRTAVYRRRHTLRITDYRCLIRLLKNATTRPWTGPELRQLRQDLEITQKDLGQILNLSPTRLSNLERSPDPLPAELSSILEKGLTKP